MSALYDAYCKRVKRYRTPEPVVRHIQREGQAPDMANPPYGDAAVARALALIRAKLAAEGVAEGDDAAVRDCLSRTVMPVKLTAIWFAYKDGMR